MEVRRKNESQEELEYSRKREQQVQNPQQKRTWGNRKRSAWLNQRAEARHSHLPVWLLSSMATRPTLFIVLSLAIEGFPSLGLKFLCLCSVNFRLGGICLCPLQVFLRTWLKRTAPSSKIPTSLVFLSLSSGKSYTCISKHIVRLVIYSTFFRIFDSECRHGKTLWVRIQLLWLQAFWGCQIY